MTLVVHGMGCPMCANNIDKQLLAVDGVEQVHVNMGTGEVKLRLAANHELSPADLTDAITRTGYTLVRINTP